MQMKYSRLTILLTASIILTACDQKEAEQPVNPMKPDAGVALQLGSSISPIVTRAFDTTWEIGNAIGVFSTKKGTTTITKSGTQDDANIGYMTSLEANTYSGGEYSYQAFSPISQDQQIYLPADGSAVDVYAYYPRNISVTASVPLSIDIPEEQTSINQKPIDVLHAKKLSTAEDPIDIDHPAQKLLFQHMMSKVIVYVMAGTGIHDTELSGNSVKSVQLLGQPTHATFAPVTSTPTFDITAGSNTITMQKVAYSETNPDPDYINHYTIQGEATARDVLHVYRAIILPNNETTNPTTSGSERQIKFSVGDTNYSYNITQTFAPGQQTIFAVRLSATGIEVTAAIKDWSHTTISPNPLYPQE